MTYIVSSGALNSTHYHYYAYTQATLPAKSSSESDGAKIAIDYFTTKAARHVNTAHIQIHIHIKILKSNKSSAVGGASLTHSGLMVWRMTKLTGSRLLGLWPLAFGQFGASYPRCIHSSHSDLLSLAPRPPPGKKRWVLRMSCYWDCLHTRVR